MKIRAKGSFFIIILFVLSFFTSFAILEGNAVENISVSAKSFENTIIIEFKNGENSLKIKTINIWLASGDSFKSFKTESGWNGKTYGDGQGLTFSTSDMLNPGESVKFGAITDKKVSAINWKIVDENENEVGPAKTEIVEISQTLIITEEEEMEVEGIQQTGEDLYGTKKFIPENLRTGSNIRLVGDGFGPDQTLQFYLNEELLKSTKSNLQGNFITTIRIPDTVDVGINQFKIINEFGSSQVSSIIINEQKNRLIKAGESIQEFKITHIPESVDLDGTLSISGVGHPTTAVLITIKNEDVLETIQVTEIGVNGEWNFQKTLDSDDNLGERTIIIKNNFKKISNNVEFVTDELFSVTAFTTTTDLGDAIVLTGTAQPNKDLTLLIKNPDDDIIRFDIIKIDESGKIRYEFARHESFNAGTYVLTATQDQQTHISLFTLGGNSFDRIVTYLDKMNFQTNSQAKLTILGPPATELTIDVFDPSDIKTFTKSIKTNSIGTKTITLDLTGYTSGVYRAVTANTSYQDTSKFSVGLSAGSGVITFSSTKTYYSPGDGILILGNTVNGNALLTISLISPSGEYVNQIEIFTDRDGAFTTETLGIPVNATSGMWKIKVHSGLDHKQIEINVAANSS